MLKYENKRVVSVQDWNKLVEETYGRPYNFQQQNGCQQRGIYTIEIPDPDGGYDTDVETIPEIVNGPEECVSFKAWLARDPKQPLSEEKHPSDFGLRLWWYRNFYPDIHLIADDLYAKGLIEAGEYQINIDW